jgi:competence protein ComEA
LRSGGAAGERSAAVACDARGSALPALRGPERLLFGQAIDLNRASAQSLEVLPRIGPSRALAIVRARRERRFQSPASLQRVKGIGPRTVAGLAGWVEVHGGRIPEPPAVP